MKTLDLGLLNGHSTGIIIKEAARRAMVAIMRERLSFEAHTKQGYGGTMDDVFTSADKAAQEVYLRTLRECFPDVGIIAEEDALRVEPKNGCDAYFTLDPLDGTKAFVRRQSHGVGTMVALVLGQEVAAAYIGDVNAGELYGYRPRSRSVWRINRLDSFEKLKFNRPFGKGNDYILLRDPVDEYAPLSQDLIKARFKSYQIDGGSIGLWAARLWKREVAALLMRPGYETPWDSTPVIGISLKLGYLFFRPDDNGSQWKQFTPLLPREVYKRTHDVLVIHKKDATSILKGL